MKKALNVTAIIIASLTVLSAAVPFTVGYISAMNEPEQQIIAATPDSMLYAINGERAKAGVKPLVADVRLVKSAQMKADDMHNNHYFDHTNPTTGQQGYEFINATGIKCKPDTPAENIAEVYEDRRGKIDNSTRNLIEIWMDSDPHKKAMLDADIDLVGFGINGQYGVQHFCDLDD